VQIRVVLAALLGICAILALFNGCKSEPRNNNLEIQLAPIHEINVSYAKSNPPQVLVTIKGGLPDNCSKFHSIQTKINGKTIEMEVTIERPKDFVCAEVYSYFEQTENLGSNFKRGEIYSVKVNEKSTFFTMQ
jgi:hypothetical protein